MGTLSTLGLSPQMFISYTPTKICSNHNSYSLFKGWIGIWGKYFKKIDMQLTYNISISGVPNAFYTSSIWTLKAILMS